MKANSIVKMELLTGFVLDIIIPRSLVTKMAIETCPVSKKKEKRLLNR